MYAWSPLVLLESLQNGHNDVVAALPSLAAVWLARSGRYRLAFPLLAMAALVKPLALALGPLLLVGRCARDHVRPGRRSRAWRLARRWPWSRSPLLVRAWSTLQGLARSELFTDSPARVLVRGLTLVGVPPETGMAAGSLMVQLLFGGILVLLCIALWRRLLFIEAAACAVYLVYCLVGAQWFNPWYLLWFAPLLSLAAGDIRKLGVMFMVLAPLLYALDPKRWSPWAVIFIPSYLLAWRYRARPRLAVSTALLVTPDHGHHGSVKKLVYFGEKGRCSRMRSGAARFGEKGRCSRMRSGDVRRRR